MRERKREIVEGNQEGGRRKKGGGTAKSVPEKLKDRVEEIGRER